MVNISTLSLKLVREKTSRYDVDNQLTTPNAVYNFIKNVIDISNEPEEVLILLTLNTKNKIIGVFEVSRGSVNSSVAHPREIFKRALLSNATSIIIAHNHPSGDSSPSSDDINITKRISDAGKIIGIELLDHIIIGEHDYTSLKSKNKF